MNEKYCESMAAYWLNKTLFYRDTWAVKSDSNGVAMFT